MDDVTSDVTSAFWSMAPLLYHQRREVHPVCNVIAVDGRRRRITAAGSDGSVRAHEVRTLPASCKLASRRRRKNTRQMAAWFFSGVDEVGGTRLCNRLLRVAHTSSVTDLQTTVIAFSIKCFCLSASQYRYFRLGYDTFTLPPNDEKYIRYVTSSP